MKEALKHVIFAVEALAEGAAIPNFQKVKKELEAAYGLLQEGATTTSDLLQQAKGDFLLRTVTETAKKVESELRAELERAARVNKDLTADYQWLKKELETAQAQLKTCTEKNEYLQKELASLSDREQEDQQPLNPDLVEAFGFALVFDSDDSNIMTYVACSGLLAIHQFGKDTWAFQGNRLHTIGQLRALRYGITGKAE